jgi:hypothetical protein
MLLLKVAWPSETEHMLVAVQQVLLSRLYRSSAAALVVTIHTLSRNRVAAGRVSNVLRFSRFCSLL